MRWKVKSNPKENDIRIVKKFLVFPLTIGDERRWLEKAVIKQKYIYSYTYDCGFAHKIGNWVDTEFIN